MSKKLFLLISIISVLAITSCIKENYDMNRLSERMHLSPTLAISAVKGDVAFKDFVKSNDTIVFDQNNLVKFVFKENSFLNLTLSDFVSVKSMSGFSGNEKEYTAGQMVATFDPYSFNLGIEEILSNLSGDILITDPSIKFIYTNSFINPVQITLNAYGKRKAKIIDLRVAPFNVLSPVAPAYLGVTSSFVIDNTNSSLDSLISMPPEEITFSGFATMATSGKGSQNDINVMAVNNLIGSIEVEVPFELRATNLQLTDTLDNFLKEDSGSNDNPVKPENFEKLRIDFSAENGFPLGVSLEMILYNSSTNAKSTVKATGILEPAPVDGNGKVNGVTETSTKIEFTKDYFRSIPKSDKIIFKFTLITTGNGTKDVKIYSDYRIGFKAALVWKPNLILK